MPAASSSATPPFGVLIVDDHPLVREGLERVIGDAEVLRVVGAVESVEAALSSGLEEVDVITLDLSLPGVSGLDGIDALLERWPSARVLVLTVHPEQTHAAACAQHGAVGFVSKNAAPSEIRAAVTAVARGEQYFSAAATEAISRQRDELRISPREMEVLRAIAGGQRITDIAEMMGVSIKTASTHKMRLQRKLGASNTAQMVMIARNRGLLS
ncbi:MAG: response regulator [Ilumatobacteraceae bacterium]